MPKIQLSLSLLKKHDNKDAITPAEITDAVSLYSINDHEWHLQAHSALLKACMMILDGLPVSNR